jgi:hypothetical protein
MFRKASLPWLTSDGGSRTLFTTALSRIWLIKWLQSFVCPKAPYTLSGFTVWRHTWSENWVNCAVLTGSSAGLKTVLCSSISHRELRSSLRESHSFVSLPTNTTMASSVASNPFSRWTSHDISLSKYHFLLHILHFLFFFPDNIMADVASKQQTTALFYPPQSHAQEHTELTTKTDKAGRKPVLCQRTFSLVLHAAFTQLNCTV